MELTDARTSSRSRLSRAALTSICMTTMTTRTKMRAASSASKTTRTRTRTRTRRRLTERQRELRQGQGQGHRGEMDGLCRLLHTPTKRSRDMVMSMLMDSGKERRGSWGTGRETAGKRKPMSAFHILTAAVAIALKRSLPLLHTSSSRLPLPPLPPRPL